MKAAYPPLLTVSLFRKHIEVHGNLDLYPGVVAMHAMARLAVLENDSAILEEVRGHLLTYVRGERTYACNFPNYLCGGIGSAYLLWKGLLPEAEASVRHQADLILTNAPRDPAGILCHPRFPGENRVWIDTAFAVVPFLLYSGLALDRRDLLEEAFQQTNKMFELFRNSENGLLHQCRNFNGPGRFSEDHWSRGNGWGAYAAVELACHLPDGDPNKNAAQKLYASHMEACLPAQDPDGLWHQEMTEKEISYVETSGSAILLWALGAGIRQGILPASHRVKFQKGIERLLVYVSEDMDVHHTCMGCLSPGNGTKLDYMARAPRVNDIHCFGPIMHAMVEAHAHGIREIKRS